MYYLGQEEIDALSEVIRSKELFKINDGPYRHSYNVERELEQMFNTPHAILMTSGFAALTTALIALGIGPGDQVIVPAYTYMATPLAVVAAGAIPVIAEVDETLTLSCEDVLKKLTPATKAIMPVHIQGFPCNMEGLCAIAEKHGLKIVEDACQADGGSFKGQRLGTFGDGGALSFNFYKIITSGEGGALFVKDKKVWEKALVYHDSSAVAFFGEQIDRKTAELVCGNEYRTNELSAALLRVQLKRLEGFLSAMRANKRYLEERLGDVCKFVPSNDPEGDCATTLALRFDSAEEAAKLAEATNKTVPINTGKHVYSNWTPIMQKKGALHPLMDPFLMEANKGIIPDYRPDMCPDTLDLLSRTVYVGISPLYTKEKLDDTVNKIRAALK